MVKVGKSWGVTLATISIAIIMIILPSFGITTISESQVTNLIYVALGLSGIGAGNATMKRIAKGKVQNNSPNDLSIIRRAITHQSNQNASLTFTKKPKIGPVGEKYQTNFVKTDKGNSLPYGNDLWIKRTGVRSYLTAELYDEKMNLMQIDQSHEHDEDDNIETTRLETSTLPRGKYFVTSQGDAGTSDSTGTKKDEFYIV